MFITATFNHCYTAPLLKRIRPEYCMGITSARCTAQTGLVEHDLCGDNDGLLVGGHSRHHPLAANWSLGVETKMELTVGVEERVGMHGLACAYQEGNV